jgi:hypothetical protein
VAWVGVVVLDAGAEDASNVVEATYLGLVAAAGLVLATGLAALGRWLRTD